MTTGHCISSYTFFFANGFPNVVTDVAIICLPIYEIWNLQLPHSQRVALASVFSFGLGATITSLVRMLPYIRAEVRTDLDFTSKKCQIF